MIGSLSNFGEALIIDSVFGRIPSYNWPGTLHFALFTTIPDDAGANGVEVSTSGTGYTRKAVTNSSTNFDPTPTSGGSKGVKTNKTAITFPTATADWGEIKGGGIYDASSGGNLLWLWEWSQSRVANKDDTMRIEAAELDFTFLGEDPLNADCVLALAMQRAFLDAFFGNPVAPTIPTELYAALMTTVPGQNTGGTLVSGSTGDESVSGFEGVELSASNYSRVQIANDATRFPAYSNGAKANGQQILWPTAGASWSGVKGVAFYSASSGGSLIAKLKLESTQNWVAGDAPRIAAGQLPIYAD
jgi:hypothetical protein